MCSKEGVDKVLVAAVRLLQSASCDGVQTSGSEASLSSPS